MTGLLVVAAVCMAVMWCGLSFLFQGDAFRGTALVIANVWACTGLLIGALR